MDTDSLFDVPLYLIREYLNGWVILCIVIVAIYFILLRNYYFAREKFYDQSMHLKNMKEIEDAEEAIEADGAKETEEFDEYEESENKNNDNNNDNDNDNDYYNYNYKKYLFCNKEDCCCKKIAKAIDDMFEAKRQKLKRIADIEDYYKNSIVPQE